MKKIIKNARVLNPHPDSAESASNVASDSTSHEDIFIVGDKIVDEKEYTANASGDEMIIDAKGKHVIPGLVDLHVHFRDPGLTHKETLGTGGEAAAAGGFTTVCCMPNTKPAIDSVETLMYIDSVGRKNDKVDIFSTAAMTKGQQGRELADIVQMNASDTLCKEYTGHGVCAISEDGMTLADADLMKEVCHLSTELDLPIMDHPEPEAKITYRDIELSKKYGAHFHIQHISTKESVDLVRQAKRDGLKVTAEAAPHHFALTEKALEIFGPNAKMNPPLATESDRIAVLEGLADDTIDVIATDHAPHTEEEKATTIAKAPFGIVGLETALPVSYTLLVKGGILSLEKLIEKMSTQPAKLIKLKEGYVRVGEFADFALVDFDEEYAIDSNTFKTKGRNTPFDKMKVQGRIIMTLKKGKITAK